MDEEDGVKSLIDKNNEDVMSSNREQNVTAGNEKTSEILGKGKSQESRQSSDSNYSPSFLCKTPFMLEADVITANKKTLPSVEEDIIKAKQFLKRQGGSGNTLYDHLADIVQKVLLYQPENIVDFIELFSSDLKNDRFQSNFDRLRDEYTLSKIFKESMQLTQLYKDLKTKRDNEMNDKNFQIEVITEENTDEDKLKIPNIFESNFYFRQLPSHEKNIVKELCKNLHLKSMFTQQAGFGLPDWEIYNLSISLNRFVNTKPVILTKIRFFGKIFGTDKNYYILETELTAEEIENRLNPKILSGADIPQEVEESKPESEVNANNPEQQEVRQSFRSDIFQSEEEMEEPQKEQEIPLPELPPIPESKWTSPKDVPPEKLGEGLNKKVYWVCNNLGDDWVSLPEVQPKFIEIARKISLAMTGDLDKELYTYPPFGGKEKDYLRAQIARIAGGTMVSPIEYYISGVEVDDEEEEVEEEGENITQIRKNKHYEGHPLVDLTDASMSFWVHNSTFVLKQGRAEWVNPNSKEINDEEEEEEAEGEEDEEQEEDREESLPLLSPLSEEEEVSRWWRLRPATQLRPPTGPSIATLRSLRWPGAVAYATVDGKFDNVYIGWGLKYLPNGYCPPLLPPVCEEYPLGPEIMEVLDPTIDEEEENRVANLPPLPLLEMGEEEGEIMEG